MGPETVRIALVLLEDRQGRFALQLRSAIPGIANPDRWGFFGGHIEEGEDPESGAIREIAEELASKLEPSKLRLADQFLRLEWMPYFVFHYPVSDELNEAQLMEGEDFDFFSVDEIRSGEIRGKEVVSYQIEVLKRFLAARK